MKKIISFSQAFSRGSKLVSMVALTVAFAKDASASTQPSSVSSSQGRFYVGGQVGVLHGEPSGNIIILSTQAGDIIGDSQSFSSNDFAWGVVGGYEYSIGFGNLGVEGFYNREQSSFRKNTKLTFQAAASDMAVYTKLDKNNTFGLTLKTSWVKEKIPVIPYLSLSLLVSDFNFSYDSVDTDGLGQDANGKQTRYLWAVAPGAGLAYPINGRLSIRLDYQYRFYQEWNVRNVNTLGTSAGLTGNFKIRDQQLTGGVVYKF